MNLDDTQKKKVAEWIAAGARLAEIQTRLASEFKVRLTYMETRMLVDDLKLTPKDPEVPKPVKPVEPVEPAIPAAASAPSGRPPAESTETMLGAKPTGGATVTVDQIARPGTMISGKVTFSDGQVAEWYLDQSGRLGLVPKQTGYRPSAADVQQFQMVLQSELSKMGMM